MTTETFNPKTGRWEPAIPEPYNYSILPWFWLRIRGWRDAYGRKAKLWKPWEL